MEAFCVLGAARGEIETRQRRRGSRDEKDAISFNGKIASIACCFRLFCSLVVVVSHAPFAATAIHPRPKELVPLSLTACSGTASNTFLFSFYYFNLSKDTDSFFSLLQSWPLLLSQRSFLSLTLSAYLLGSFIRLFAAVAILLLISFLGPAQTSRALLPLLIRLAFSTATLLYSVPPITPHPPVAPNGTQIDDRPRFAEPNATNGEIENRLYFSFLRKSSQGTLKFTRARPLPQKAPHHRCMPQAGHHCRPLPRPL